MSLKKNFESEHDQLDDAYWMRLALAQAREAETEFDEVPVGAVLVRGEALIAARGNRTIANHDCTAHAEILALRAAGQIENNYRLPGTTLYVTLEPCAMCAMALVHARVARVVFAARDPKTGAAGSVFDVLNSDRHNHKIDVTEGVLADDASKLLSNFFRRKRGKSLL